jgi:hypothetical protein
MELAIILTSLYIIPAILSVFVIIHKSDKVTVLDLIGIILLSLLPLINLVSGYAGGLIWLCESEKIDKFLNKRIK